eukprot:gene19784-biopygen12896
MAQLCFSGGALGRVSLPLMVFHQLQLMVCAVPAQRCAKREGISASGGLGESATTDLPPSASEAVAGRKLMGSAGLRQPAAHS